MMDLVSSCSRRAGGKFSLSPSLRGIPFTKTSSTFEQKTCNPAKRVAFFYQREKKQLPKVFFPKAKANKKKTIADFFSAIDAQEKKDSFLKYKHRISGHTLLHAILFDGEELEHF